MNEEEIWQAVLAQIQFNISRANFATWFHGTRVVSNHNGEVVISVANSFAKEWLSTKYQSLILKILRSLDSGIRLVDFVIKPKTTLPTKTIIEEKEQPALEPQLQFQEFQLDQKTNLNPHYQFQNFIVGSFNELAHAAGMAVAEKPGLTYNPLFIYGGVGLGKTHLLQAIGNKVLKQCPEKKIRYTTSERFISKIVEAIRNQEIDELKKRLNRVDILIIDDVQFFAGKEKTQEEFFHIFNSLYQSQKQIILSSDRPPNAIPTLEERLKSRFEGGMIADIGMPDMETRLAILKTKCEEKEINLDGQILDYIAANVQKNIRELEGALNRLIVFKKLNQGPLDTEAIRKLLKSLIISPQKTTSAKQIIQTVSNFYDLGEDDLLIATRRKEIVKPRQIAMYLLREELHDSYPSIGRKFRGKDHTTAMYACEKIAQQIEENGIMYNEIHLIRQRLYNDF